MDAERAGRSVSYFPIMVHGTSTLYNDEMESIAITRAGLEGVPVGSLKGYYGHTLGAAGILESVLCMQSTHNIISSLIAIHTKSHCYNVTYSHRSISFDSALFDAYLQILTGKIGNALVGGHDELTPSYFSILRKIGYLGVEGMAVSSETAVSYVVSNNPDNSLCRIAGFKMLYNPSQELLNSTIDTLLNENGLEANAKPISLSIISGFNGNPENDRPYASLIGGNPLLKQCPQLRYKHIFGENYTSSGFGPLTAAMNLKENKAECILYLNHSDGKCWSIILFEKR